MEKSQRNIVLDASLDIEHRITNMGISINYWSIFSSIKNRKFLKQYLKNNSYTQNTNRNLIGNYIEYISKKLRFSSKEIYDGALISKSYFYKIKNGDCHPSRDVVIQLCFALQLNLKETNLLLKKAGYNELYLRNNRDMIIAHHLENGSNLIDVNLELEENGMDIFDSQS